MSVRYFLIEFLESWGRGIGLMMSECEKANLPEPENHIGDSEIKLIFHYHPSTTQAPLKYHPSSTQVKTLVETIGVNIYSTKEMMDLLQLKNRRHFTKEYLKPSIEQGFVALVFPEQPNHPQQKYYLTEKGKQLLKL